MRLLTLFKTASLAAAVASASSVSIAGNLLENYGAEADLNGDHWVAAQGNWRKSYGNSGNTREGDYFFLGRKNPGENTAELNQVISLNSETLSLAEQKDLADGNLTFYFEGYAQGWLAGAQVGLDFIDSDGTIIETELGDIISGSGWIKLSFESTAPANTAHVKLRLIATNLGNYSNVNYDNLSLSTTKSNNTLVKNGYGNTESLEGWVIDEGSFHVDQNGRIVGDNQDSLSMHQVIDLSSYASSIDAGSQVFTFRGMFVGDLFGDTVGIKLDYLDAEGFVVHSWDTGLHNPYIWSNTKNEVTPPQGTRSAKITLYGEKNTATYSGKWDQLELLSFYRAPVQENTDIVAGEPPYQYTDSYVLSECGEDVNFNMNTRIAIAPAGVSAEETLINASGVKIPVNVPLTCNADGSVAVEVNLSDSDDTLVGQCITYLEANHSTPYEDNLLIPESWRPIICKAYRDVAQFLANAYIDNRYPGNPVAADLEIADTTNGLVKLFGYDGVVNDSWTLSGSEDPISMEMFVFDHGGTDALSFNLQTPLIVPSFDFTLAGETVSVGTTACLAADVKLFDGKFETVDDSSVLTGTSNFKTGGVCGTTINDEYLLAIEMDAGVEVHATFVKESNE